MAEMKQYLQAFENEICNDERAYQLNLVSSSDYGYLPRPVKWLSRFKNQQKVLGLVAFFLKYFWYCGGAIIFFTIQGVRDFLKFKKVSVKSEDLGRFKEFGLGFSARAFEVMNASSLGHNLECWLVLPWVDVKPELSAHAHVVNIFSLMKPRDFLMAWVYSVQTVYVCLFRKEFRSQVLQSYTAFRWYLTRFGLSRVRGGDFYTSEHFDRWSILADHLVLQMKSQGFLPTLSMVQHGLLGSLTQVNGEKSDQQGGLYVKHRLNSVNHLYVYDQVSADIFTQKILVQDPVSKIEIHFYKPQINLQKISKSQIADYSILFVGHPMCENFHLALFQKLTADKSLKLRFFYKPHPTNAAHHSIREKSWVIIDDKSYFPEVDLLVSYPSTLVSEYAFLGIEAVIHPINISVDQVESFYLQLISKINKI